MVTPSKFKEIHEGLGNARLIGTREHETVHEGAKVRKVYNLFSVHVHEACCVDEGAGR
jgi:hypothetical protein